MDNNLAFLDYDPNMENFFKRSPYRGISILKPDIWRPDIVFEADGSPRRRKQSRNRRSKSRNRRSKSQSKNRNRNRRSKSRSRSSGSSKQHIPAFIIPRKQHPFDRTYTPRLENYTMLDVEPFRYRSPVRLNNKRPILNSNSPRRK